MIPGFFYKYTCFGVGGVTILFSTFGANKTYEKGNIINISTSVAILL